MAPQSSTVFKSLYRQSRKVWSGQSVYPLFFPIPTLTRPDNEKPFPLGTVDILRHSCLCVCLCVCLPPCIFLRGGGWGANTRAVESASLKVGKSLKIGKNRIKIKYNRIKLENQKKIGKIKFDLNSDSTALFRIH